MHSSRKEILGTGPPDSCRRDDRGPARRGHVSTERPPQNAWAEKAPLAVLDDVDIDAAVNAAAFGPFMNQGQICMSTERVVVDEKVADEFVQRLSAKAAGLPVRDPSL